jgi:transposase
MRAVGERADAQRQIKTLIVTAPDPLRSQLRELSDRRLIEVCATRRPDRAAAVDPAVATVIALQLPQITSRSDPRGQQPGRTRADHG